MVTTVDLSVNMAGLSFKNPVFTASGTFAPESGDFYDYGLLGAITTKGVSATPWLGNDTPRIAETPCGMLNAVGLENPGVDAFIGGTLKTLRRNITDTRVIANVAGRTINEFVTAALALDSTGDIDMLELNISCPNIEEAGKTFAQSEQAAYDITYAVKRVTNKPLFVKLSPNVADITQIARAVESAGADGLSLINTVAGMKIDVNKRSVALANTFGGISGPAIRPVAIRAVYLCSRAVRLPIIGMGGIMSGEDAAEFFMAGADAVAVGMASFRNPTAPIDILNELQAFMIKHRFANIKELKTCLNE